MEAQKFMAPTRLGVTESEEGMLEFLVDGFGEQEIEGKEEVRLKRVRRPKQEED